MLGVAVSLWGVFCVIHEGRRTLRGPSAAMAFTLAALFLAMALWVGFGQSLWTVGLLAMSAAWVGLGVRALRRRRKAR